MIILIALLIVLCVIIGAETLATTLVCGKPFNKEKTNKLISLLKSTHPHDFRLNCYNNKILSVKNKDWFISNNPYSFLFSHYIYGHGLIYRRSRLYFEIKNCYKIAKENQNLPEEKAFIEYLKSQNDL